MSSGIVLGWPWREELTPGMLCSVRVLVGLMQGRVWPVNAKDVTYGDYLFCRVWGAEASHVAVACVQDWPSVKAPAGLKAQMSFPTWPRVACAVNTAAGRTSVSVLLIRGSLETWACFLLHFAPICLFPLLTLSVSCHCNHEYNSPSESRGSF